MFVHLKARKALAIGLVAGCAALTGIGSASAQDLAAAAYAPAAPAKPRANYVVFLDQNGTADSSAAGATIRLAADAARAKKAQVIRLIGRADHTEAVKAALVLQGIVPTSIVMVGRDDTAPVIRASTGFVEPMSRYVLIAF